MAYSTIIKKKCKGEGCKKYPVLGLDGWCWSCVPEDIKEKVGSKRDLARKKKNSRISQAAKLRTVQRELNGDSELELWFLMRMNSAEFKCDNCDASKWELKNWSKGWRSCQAHLLPKRHFDSIKTHPLNGVVLGSGFSGMCHCHDDYDSNWQKASTMRIWPEVIRRFKIMYPLILPSEYRFIPDVLLKTLEVNQPISLEQPDNATQENNNSDNGFNRSGYRSNETFNAVDNDPKNNQE